MNDRISVNAFLSTKDYKVSERTTVLPKSWVFNQQGNTKLKRKRKHATDITEDDKRSEWLNFCCQTWQVKLNRESKTRIIKRLQTTSSKIIEDEIKQRNDGQI